MGCGEAGGTVIHYRIGQKGKGRVLPDDTWAGTAATFVQRNSLTSMALPLGRQNEGESLSFRLSMGDP